jgi:hypothetical protein
MDPMHSKIKKLVETVRPLYRRELHAAVGGQTQSGISPSAKERVILLFSDPVSGPEHGYIDNWQADGFYHYTGEGQRGDQVMMRGNKAIRDHTLSERELHLFQAAGKSKPITYIGEFHHEDHYDADAPETGGGPIRKVIIFRLKPLRTFSRAGQGQVKKAKVDSVEEVPVESCNTEKAVVEPSRELYESERVEAKLVQKFIAWSRRAGREYKRYRIVPRGEAKPIFSDLYSKKTNQLIEAKGSVSRDAIRMAIGQLFDYKRFAPARTDLTVLLPECPRPDLVELIRSAGISMIHEKNGEFVLMPEK